MSVTRVTCINVNVYSMLKAWFLDSWLDFPLYFTFFIYLFSAGLIALQWLNKPMSVLLSEQESREVQNFIFDYKTEALNSWTSTKTRTVVFTSEVDGLWSVKFNVLLKFLYCVYFFKHIWGLFVNRLWQRLCCFRILESG